MKYYTAFLFDDSIKEKDFVGNPIHITHKYLGEQSEETIEKILDIVDVYIKQPIKFPECSFEKEEYFGESKNIRVLIPEHSNLSIFWPELRESLNSFKKDDFPNYQPHVTSSLKKVNFPIAFYALIGNGKIIKKWGK